MRFGIGGEHGDASEEAHMYRDDCETREQNTVRLALLTTLGDIRRVHQPSGRQWQPQLDDPTTRQNASAIRNELPRHETWGLTVKGIATGGQQAPVSSRRHLHS